MRRIPAGGLVTLTVALLALTGLMGRQGWPLQGGADPALATGAAGHAQAHEHDKPTRAQVRPTLEKLLGHHAILAIRMARAQLNKAPDFTLVLRDALGANTGDLSALIASLHGDQAGESFRRLWTRHNIALFKFAEAESLNQPEGKDVALARLNRYERDFGAFVEKATNSALKAQDVSRALKVHIDQMIEQVEAYSSGHYGRAYRLQRHAYAHMFAVGKILAAGLTGTLHGSSATPVHNPSADLQSTLTWLLGEHVELVIDATRAGLRELPEFPAAAQGLNANTRDLSQAIDTLFGRRNARQFADVWSDHIELFVDYTAATAAGNESEMEKARQKLETFPSRLARFLGRVTGFKQIDVLDKELSTHEDLLIRQIDAYADKDFNTAHQVAYQTYQHMTSTAAVLAGLIGERARTVIPIGGPQTGGGGTA